MNDRLYAELIVNKALNIKDGSILRIRANTENLPFAREVARMAYEKGAAEGPNPVDVLIKSGLTSFDISASFLICSARFKFCPSSLRK